MLYHRQNIIDIQKFLESENAHEGLLEARELLKSPSHFANLVAHQQLQVKLPAQSTQLYWKEIVTTGAPSKSDIINEIRNFFEGPINMDLMIAGAFKNVFENILVKNTGDEGVPDKKWVDDLKATGIDLATCLVGSQQATMALDNENDIEQAYMILKYNIEPKIKQVCLDDTAIKNFQKLLFKMETHMFAAREYKKLVQIKQNEYQKLVQKKI